MHSITPLVAIIAVRLSMTIMTITRILLVITGKPMRLGASQMGFLSAAVVNIAMLISNKLLIVLTGGRTNLLK